VKGAIVRRLGRVEYEPTWHAMQAFTATRVEATPDELWLLQHPPVYTLGQAGPLVQALQAHDLFLTKLLGY
jgi:lipoyl(octanoyl) transferase